MLLSHSRDADVEWLHRAFDNSPQLGWQMLSAHLGNDVTSEAALSDGSRRPFNTNDAVFRLAQRAMVYAASRAIIDSDSCYVCSFVDDVQSRSPSDRSRENVFLDRYKNDILVHFHLLGFKKSIDAKRLWNECMADATGTWKLARSPEHRDYPRWGIKQGLSFFQMCTISELASLCGEYRETATTDMFLLSASGIASLKSTLVPAWYSRLQEFDFVRMFEGGVQDAIDEFQGRTMAQMCDSPLIQASAPRLLARFKKAFLAVDVFYADAPDGQSCPFSNTLRTLRSDEKAPFAKAVDTLIERVSAMDSWNYKPRRNPTAVLSL